MLMCWAVFFVSFSLVPKIDDNDGKPSKFCLKSGFVLAIQTNSKSGEDVSQIIEPEWFVEKSALKSDI